MAAACDSFDWQGEIAPQLQAALAPEEPRSSAIKGSGVEGLLLLNDDDHHHHDDGRQVVAGAWGALEGVSPRSSDEGDGGDDAAGAEEQEEQELLVPALALAGLVGGSSNSSDAVLDVSGGMTAAATAQARLAEAEANLAELEARIRASEAKGRAAAEAASAELAQARAKALALEEELKTARELIEDNGGLYDDEFVERLVSEHAQLKAQVNESTGALIEAAQAPDDDEEDEAEPAAGCLKGVLRLKGVGFLTFAEVERALRKDHVSKETVEALFDAMGGLITDASFEVFQRRMGEIVGEDRAAVAEKLAAVPLTGKKRPRPEALEALAALFVSKRREMEEHNPSGVYASYKLWVPAAGREQSLPEAVRAVVAAHGQLRAQLQAAKAENAALRRQVGGGSAGAGTPSGRGRSVSPVPSPVMRGGAGAGAGSTRARSRSRSPVPGSGPGSARAGR